jgi:hypothetical protein
LSKDLGPEVNADDAKHISMYGHQKAKEKP